MAVDDDGVVQGEEETPVPVNLSVVVAELRKTKDEIKELEEKVKELSKVEEEFTKLLVQEMQLQGVSSFKTEMGSVFLKTREYFSVEDFPALCQYVMETGHFELFQRRVSGEAAKEIMEQSGTSKVPGITSYEKDVILFRRK